MWKDNDWSMLGCKDFWEKDAEKQREKERLRLKKNINCVVYFRDKAIEKVTDLIWEEIFRGEEQ